MPRHTQITMSLHEKLMKGVKGRPSKPRASQSTTSPPIDLFLAANPEETGAASSFANMRKSRMSESLLVKTPRARMGDTSSFLVVDGFTFKDENRVSLPEACEVEAKDEDNAETFIDDITIKEEEPEGCDPLLTFPCNDCENVYATKCELEVHLKEGHKDENLFSCMNCDEEFLEEGELALHAELHVKREKVNGKVTSEPSETLVWSSAASELIVNPPSIDMASKGEADSRQFTMTTDLTRCPTLRDYTSSTPLNNSLNDATPLRPSKKRKQNSSDVTHSDDQFMKVLADVHKISTRPSFQEHWLRDSQFKGWLVGIDGTTSKAYCRLCHKKLSAEITSLKRHRLSQKHVALEKNQKTTPARSTTTFRPPPEPSKIMNGVAYATILFVVFLAEHNLPFRLCGDLMELNKRMFPDSEIAAQMAIRRKKCASLVQSLGDYASQKLANKLTKSKFSLIVDEVSDCGSEKACAVGVRYFDVDENVIKTTMLDVVNVCEGNEAGPTGEGLYSKLVSSLGLLSIPTSNLIGFAYDGASNMMGVFNSVSNLLRDSFPGISVFKCVSSRIQICANEASKALPESCENLVHNIYSFFGQSGKRHEFENHQLFCNTKHFSATQWLSIHEAVARIIEQWQPLKMFFTNVLWKDRSSAVEQICDAMRNPSVYCYLVYLNYILPHITSISEVFESTSTNFHLLHDKISGLYRLLLNDFCDSHKVAASALHEIEPCDPSYHLPIEQINLGEEVNSLFSQPEYKDDMVRDIRLRCRTFMIAACQQIKERFDLNNKLWRLASFLNPKQVLDEDVRSHQPSISDLLKEVPRINHFSSRMLDDQWRSICYHVFPEHIKSAQDDAGAFYKGLIEFEDDAGRRIYEHFGRFAMQILSLPASNADAKRVFSELNFFKRKERNSLKMSTVKSLIHLRECAASKDGVFEPDKGMVMHLAST
ncbi:uncharacterized protein [Penaeus vannamei]|uniref:uncharacterized protein isoform X1 n=1 Tax=Penaeus vannamei TaxID=6689 RepID=UPI00387F3AB1